MRKPRNLVEYLAAIFAPSQRDDWREGQIVRDRPDPFQVPERWAGQSPQPLQDPVPAWVSDQPHRAPPQGPFMPLPRESELPARLAMLEQVRRERAGQISDYRPPRLVYGPGAVTGEQEAARVRFRDVAPEPVPPFFLPVPSRLPPALRARLADEGRRPEVGGRPGFGPPSATFQTSEAYRRARGTPTYTAHYRARMLPNGSAIRTSEPRFDPIPEPPQSAREPVQSDQIDLDAEWRAAHERARLRR